MKRCLALGLLCLSLQSLAFDLQGHRGARGHAPENTLPGFERALAIGVDTLELDVGVTRDGDRARLRVRDRGAGLPPPEVKRIFKRFYRIPGPLTQRVKGTGLGLFIVHTTAKQHGGRAYAESDGLGHGSTFYLDLPGAPPAGA